MARIVWSGKFPYTRPGILPLVCLLVGAAALASAGEPQLHVEQTEIDLGSKPFNTAVWHTFSIENNGSAPLFILDVHKSCGCTYSLLQRDSIAPGESTSLRVGYVPKEGQRKVGQQTFSVTLKTNDPHNPSTSFTVHADLIAPVTSVPNRIDFGTVTREDKPERQIKITFTDKAHTTSDITAKPLSNALKVQRLSDSKSEPAYKVTLLANRLTGNLDASVIFNLGLPDFPALEIPVSADLKLPYMAQPAQAVLGVVNKGGDRSLHVVLRPTEHNAPRLKKAQCTNSEVRAQVQEAGDNGAWNCDITIHAADKQEKIKTVVTVYDDHDKLAAAIPVLAYVR